jgi:hypothetical protein
VRALTSPDEESSITFDFSAALSAYKVDIQGEIPNGFHMVDYLIETEKIMLLLEVKNLNVSKATEQSRKVFYEKLKSGKFTYDMVYKYKDTLLYQMACDNKIEKPIYYYVILEENEIPVNSRLAITKKIYSLLPWHMEKIVEIKNPLIENFAIISLSDWNHLFPQFKAIVVNT